MNVELKPCPFCGQKQDDRQMLVLLTCDTDGYYIMCDACGTCGAAGYPEMAEEKAYDNWNSLAGKTDALRAELARKDEEIKMLNGFYLETIRPDRQESLISIHDYTFAPPTKPKTE